MQWKIGMACRLVPLAVVGLKPAVCRAMLVAYGRSCPSADCIVVMLPSGWIDSAVPSDERVSHRFSPPRHALRAFSQCLSWSIVLASLHLFPDKEHLRTHGHGSEHVVYLIGTQNMRCAPEPEVFAAISASALGQASERACSFHVMSTIGAVNGIRV